MSKINLEFDNHIKNIDELMTQLESLKDEAFLMMRTPNHDEIFVKDYHALKITINFLIEYLKAQENEKDIKRTLERWLDLLETDGIDSKNMVAIDIQRLLEK